MWRSDSSAGSLPTMAIVCLVRVCTLRLGMLDHLTSFPFCSCVFVPGALPAASLSLGKHGVARSPHGHGLDVVASGVPGK